MVSDSIVVDHTPPQVSPPIVSLRTGLLAASAATASVPTASVPIAATWEARDDVAGLADATVLVDCGEIGTARTDAPGTAAPGRSTDWTADAFTYPDAECAITAIGRDGAGNVTRADSERFTTTWVDAAASVVEGDQVGVVATRGPDGGRAAVLVDGVAVGLIELYVPEMSGPEVVFVTDMTAGSHRIEVQPTGSADAASTGSHHRGRWLHHVGSLTPSAYRMSGMLRPGTNPEGDIATRSQPSRR